MFAIDDPFSISRSKNLRFFNNHFNFNIQESNLHFYVKLGYMLIYVLFSEEIKDRIQADVFSDACKESGLLLK